MKIQLDHKALTKLIEDSGEDFELSIQKGVVHTIVSKTIKAKSQGDVLEFVQEAISKISSEDHLYSRYGYGNKSLSTKADKIIKDACEKKVKSLLKTRIDPIVKSRIEKITDTVLIEKMSNIENIINAKFNSKLSEYIEEQIKLRLEALT